MAALLVAVWLASVHLQSRPAALAADAPATQFSAARASAALGRVLGSERPHPTGSAESAALRTRLLRELDTLELHPRTVTEMSCFTRQRWGAIVCGTVSNVIAGLSPGSGKQVVLMAHTDSVAAGPGACDDGCGMATLLESIRALKARGLTGEHPIVAVFTDGEEAGLLGAAALFRDPLRVAKTGAVINVDDRGNSGPSYLFQTSAGEGPLIDLYAAKTSHYATSSLYAEIFEYLPNDTDFTPVLAAGVPGVNFALIGNVADYHTPNDTLSHIDLRGLQSHGDAELELADAFSRLDFATLKGERLIYLDVLGRWLPRLPMRWALPLSLLCLALLALAAFLTRRERRIAPRPILAALMPPLLLLGCVAMGFGLHALAAFISGNADPSFAFPLYLRLSLGFGAFAVALLAARGAGPMASWLWFALLAVAAAIWAPGLSPYFLFPCLVAAPLLLLTVRGGRDMALLVSAIPALLLWIGLTANTEPLMGLKAHPIFMVTAGFGLIAALPLLARVKTGWGISLAVSLVAAIALAVAAGFAPPFSQAAPQRLNIRYLEKDGKAWWLADGVEHLPDPLRAAAAFSPRPVSLIDSAYAAPAGKARAPAPGARVARQGDSVIIDLQDQGDGVALRVPKEAGLRSLTLGGVTTPAPRDRRVTISCVTPDCATAHLRLDVANPAAFAIDLLVFRRGLPPEGAKLQKARPVWAVPSQTGDISVFATRIAVPGGG